MGTKHFTSTFLLLAAVAAGTAMLQAQGGIQIAARDSLTITVPGREDLTKKVIVDVDGMFDYPYLGRVKAAGLTTRDIAAVLKKGLDPDVAVNCTVVVDLEQTASKRFNIMGEVKASGWYPFAGQVRLLEALARAGSVTDAAAEELIIIHQGTDGSQGETTHIDLFDLLNGSEAGQKNNVLIQDNDLINVLKAKPVYVTGYVKSVGAYPVRRGMTVSEVLALAGGVNEKGKTSGIKIERPDPSGKKQQQTIQVKDIKTEVVKPGDTIIVPARIW